MNILFDAWSSQVMFQQAPEGNYYPGGFMHPEATGQRLNTLLGAMQSFGNSTKAEWNLFFANPPITQQQLNNFNGNKIDVYVSLTRYINIPINNTTNPEPMSTGFAYQGYDPNNPTVPVANSELACLQTFVQNGGGVLLMTDHGQPPKNPKNDDWTENDKALAAVFGVTLQNYFVSNISQYMIMKVNSDSFSPRNPLNYLANQVSGIAAHDSCIIVPPQKFTSLVELPADAYCKDKSGTCIKPIPSKYFSVLVPYGKGNVIVAGNSGMVGDYGSPRPAPGLITMENNLMFFLNCIGFLGGLTCIPGLGQGPCVNLE